VSAVRLTEAAQTLWLRARGVSARARG
jgi:hypothetical protein